MKLFHSVVNTFSRELSSFYDERLQKFGLATSYVEIMVLLRAEEKISQKKLAEELALAPSTITRFVNKLIKEAYVNKKREGRNVVVELTEKGKQLSGEMEREYQKTEDEVEQLLSSKYLDTVGKLLEFGCTELEKYHAENKSEL